MRVRHFQWCTCASTGPGGSPNARVCIPLGSRGNCTNQSSIQYSIRKYKIELRSTKYLYLIRKSLVFATQNTVPFTSVPEVVPLKADRLLALLL